MSDKPKSLEEIDAFWELDSLLPQKKRPLPRREVNTDTVELELPDGAEAVDSRFGGSAIPPASESAPPRRESVSHRPDPMRTKASLTARREPVPLDPYLEYKPASSLIRSVAVAKWRTDYTFYEKFRSDAHKAAELTPAKCEQVSYFSYIPQFSQLSPKQLKWYVWWRSQVIQHSYPATAYSYILLYVYEIINCPELTPPELGLERLCDIWLAYRASHPRIDNYLGEWLCDYCLINGLACPTERLEPILQAAVSAVSFKEFYIGATKAGSGASNVLAFTSNYDWRTSRYVTSENFAVFAEHIPAAFDKIYRELLSVKLGDDTVKAVTVTRDAYAGALCVWDMKRCLTVKYLTYTRSPRFRFIVTDIIKYCENRVRMALGIKARLKTEELTDEMKRCLDAYFDAKLPIPTKRSAKSAKPVEVNEYEKLYEPTSREFSLESALEIERSSWSTTEILTSALGDDSALGEGGLPQSGCPMPSNKSAVPAPGCAASGSSPSGERLREVGRDTAEELEPSLASVSDASGVVEPTPAPFAELAARLDEHARRALAGMLAGEPRALELAADEAGVLVDALADRINELSYDCIGDSVVEARDGGYAIIEDYRDSLAGVCVTTAAAPAPFEELAARLDEHARRALAGMLAGEPRALELAADEAGVLVDALADRINELSYDCIGDSVVEARDGGYAIIEDYKGDIEKCLS